MSCGVTERNYAIAWHWLTVRGKPCARILSRYASRLICTETRSCVRCCGNIRRIKQSWACERSVSVWRRCLWWRRLPQASQRERDVWPTGNSWVALAVSATPVGNIRVPHGAGHSRCLSAREVHLSSGWWTDVRQVPKMEPIFQ